MSAKDNLSGGQFPDHVPDDLVRPDTTGRNSVYYQGEHGKGPRYIVVPGHAPNQEDFNEMPSPPIEGRVGPSRMTGEDFHYVMKPDSVERLPADNRLRSNSERIRYHDVTAVLSDYSGKMLRTIYQPGPQGDTK